ncbi:hypothetical protein OAN94_05255 [Verrucomicrobiales bacterium]|nr:hypothetical protein [Verrucomicrobiales bacterium]
MKTMASNAEKIPGFGGTFGDPRSTVVVQSDEEAATDGALRVLWDPATKQSTAYCRRLRALVGP